jgi:hypothetical protein
LRDIGLALGVNRDTHGRTAQRVPRLDARAGTDATLAARQAASPSRQAELTTTRDNRPPRVAGCAIDDRGLRAFQVLDPSRGA